MRITLNLQSTVRLRQRGASFVGGGCTIPEHGFHREWPVSPPECPEAYAHRVLSQRIRRGTNRTDVGFYFRKGAVILSSTSDQRHVSPGRSALPRRGRTLQRSRQRPATAPPGTVARVGPFALPGKGGTRARSRTCRGPVRGIAAPAAAGGQLPAVRLASRGAGHAGRGAGHGAPAARHPHGHVPVPPPPLRCHLRHPGPGLSAGLLSPRGLTAGGGLR